MICFFTKGAFWWQEEAGQGEMIHGAMAKHESVILRLILVSDEFCGSLGLKQ